MAKKVVKNKGDYAFHFSLRAFFKGVGESLYAFFVSAGEAIQRLYTMFEASMARERFKRRGRSYHAASKASDECNVPLALLENYEAHFATNQKSRVLSFELKEATDLALLWKKVFDSFITAERPTEEAVKDASSFMLALIDENAVRHLDFSHYSISLENGCFERFTVFLKELLDCNPNIAHITLHPDNQSLLPPEIQERLKQHQALYMAEKYLIDREYPIQQNTRLTVENVQDFFLTHQAKVIERYEVRTSVRLSTIDPEAGREHSQIGELESVKPTTPWGFILRMGRSLKQRLLSVKEAFEEDSSEEIRASITEPVQAVVTYAGSVSNSVAQSFSAISSRLSGFFASNKEDPWYYFDKTAQPVDQLKQRVKEAERMLGLAKRLENLPVRPANEEERIACAIEKARIFCDIAFNGLFYKPEVNMDFLHDRSIAYDREAFLAEMDKEKDPVKQKRLLVNPDKLRNQALWVDAYGDKAAEKRALLNQASDLITNGYREWLDELNRSPEEGGYPSIGVTDEEGKPINAVQQFIQEFIIKQKRESLGLYNDIMKSREANDRRFEKRFQQCVKQEALLNKRIEQQQKEAEQQEELLGIYRFYGETADRLEKDPELLEKVREAAKKEGFTFSTSAHSQSHNSFFATSDVSVEIDVRNKTHSFS
jgi:hypothetical protein